MIDNIKNNENADTNENIEVDNVLDVIDAIAAKLFRSKYDNDIERCTALISKIMCGSGDIDISDLNNIISYLNEKNPDHPYHNRWLFNADTHNCRDHSSYFKWKVPIETFYEDLMNDNNDVYALNDIKGWVYAIICFYDTEYLGNDNDGVGWTANDFEKLYIHLREKMGGEDVEVPYYLDMKGAQKLDSIYKEHVKQQEKENRKRKIMEEIGNIESQIKKLKLEFDNLTEK